MNIYFCIVTMRFGTLTQRFFNSPEAVARFIHTTPDGWELFAAEWEDGELKHTRRITNHQFVDEDGGIEAVLGLCGVAA